MMNDAIKQHIVRVNTSSKSSTNTQCNTQVIMHR